MQSSSADAHIRFLYTQEHNARNPTSCTSVGKWEQSGGETRTVTRRVPKPHLWSMMHTQTWDKTTPFPGDDTFDADCDLVSWRAATLNTERGGGIDWHNLSTRRRYSNGLRVYHLDFPRTSCNEKTKIGIE